MTDTPWLGDACSLVEAFRAKERSPLEELDATLAAIEASDLNAFVHLDEERARATAAQADTTLPFGGVPLGIKSLDSVEGWPYTEESLVFADRIADHTSTHMTRMLGRGGMVPVGQTLASEFGGLNVSTNKLHGTCHNPWQHGRTAGGSSGGSSAAGAGAHAFWEWGTRGTPANEVARMHRVLTAALITAGFHAADGTVVPPAVGPIGSRTRDVVR